MHGDHARKNDSPVDHWVAEVMQRMNRRLDEDVATTYRIITGEVPELRWANAPADLLEPTIAANLTTVYGALAHAVPVEDLVPPAVAIKYAHRLAQRGVPLTALLRAYRLGQQTVLRRIFYEIDGIPKEHGVSLAVSQQIVDVAFQYIDWISRIVVGAYVAERERWIGSRGNVISAKVREILNGELTDENLATQMIGYELAQPHIAIVASITDVDRTHKLHPGRIQTLIEELGAVDSTAPKPLFVAVDSCTGWGWVPLLHLPGTHELARMVSIVRERFADVSVALGMPSAGLSGFRSSHFQAEQVKRLIDSAGGRVRLASFADPGVAIAAFIAEDQARARAWVEQILGPLSADTEQASRMRRTVQVYLQNGSSPRAAAAHLDMHYNTVKYRLKAVEQDLGRGIDENRLDLEVALLVHQWLGR